MPLDVLDDALAWASFYDARGAQHALNLTGIGESLLHPELPEVVRRAREALPTCDILFSTNGIGLTDETCALLAEHRVGLSVSLHRPEKASKAMELAQRHGILLGSHTAFVELSHDFAGNVEWTTRSAPRPCEYLNGGWITVMVDGRISTCCLDAGGVGIIGHVSERERMSTLTVEPFSLCDTCHLVP